MTEPITGFLSESGKALAQRFVSALALPGLLFLTVLATAGVLGHRHALDAHRLLDAVEGLVGRYNGRPVPAVLTLIAAAIAGSAVGILCGGLGVLIQRLWLFTRPRGLVRRLVDHRRRRWETADARFAAADEVANRGDTAQLQALTALSAQRNAIALARPGYPTWTADRLAATGTRVWAEYGLDLSFSWPRLWLVLSDTAREEIRTASRAFTAALVIQAWGLLYLLVGLLWWPSAVVGIGAVLTGWRRGRTAAATLADLVEASVDLNVRVLLESMTGEVPPGVIDRATGERLNRQIRKGA